ncbi:MAG: hypothetical protein COT85_05980 [Chlamydiae bacterium CG10_big_fil_rev_8_21_14_0_10_42_34]|nr:MAG: hypothetical protein COT85_05980 [Chlamydiae bacterium CG10_big_fil_rev_8_21_14_0_10_42_34]
MSLDVKPTIYINEQHLDQPSAPAELKAPQVIGDIWARMQAALKANNLPHATELMAKLGVTETDKTAQQLLIPILNAALNENVKIVPAEDEECSGVYFLSLANEEPFAVFKIGEKRARTELLVRHIAHKVGLEKHAIPGIFCSIANPDFSKGETTVELWNGNKKLYEHLNNKHTSYSESVSIDNFGLENPPTITGILEPFVSTKGELDVENFASMTAFALIVGLRDAKLDGIVGSMFIDNEECMPARLHPLSSPEKHPAATHLPYLKHPLAEKSIPLATIESLYKTLSNLDIRPLLNELATQKVLYRDSIAESIDLDDDGWDHGGCYVKIDDISRNALDIYPKIDLTDERLVSERQLTTCSHRISKLLSFFETCMVNQESPNAIDMVCAVDEHFAKHFNGLSDPDSDRIHQRLRHFVVGAQSPAKSFSLPFCRDLFSVPSSKDSSNPSSGEPSSDTPPPQNFGAIVPKSAFSPWNSQQTSNVTSPRTAEDEKKESD